MGLESRSFRLDKPAFCGFISESGICFPLGNGMTEKTKAGWPAVSIHVIPEDVAGILESSGLGPGVCLLCAASRLTPDGHFGESWLAVSPERLAVVQRNGHKAETSASFLLSAVKGARTEKVSGGGMLLLNVEGATREVLRFDLGQAAFFGGVAQRLHKHLAPAKKKKEGSEGQEGQEAVKERPAEPPVPLHFDDLLEKERELHCPKCRRPFPKQTQICPFCAPHSSTLRRLLGFARPFRKHLAGMAVLMVVDMSLQLIPPQLQRELIDSVLTDPGQAVRLPGLLGLLALVMVLHHLVGIVRGRLGIQVGCNITNHIQSQAFRHLQALSLSYFNKQQTGALMSRINNDTRQMQGFLTDGLQYTAINILVLLGVATVLIWMNPLLGLVALIPAPIVVVLSAFVWRRIHKRFHLLWSAFSAVTSYLNDVLSGIRVVKAFGREKSEIERFEEKIGLSRDRMIDAEMAWQTLVPVLNMIVQSSLLLVWYFGAYEVYGQRLTLGELFAYISYLSMVYGPLQLLTRLNDWLSRSLTAAARVFEILDVQPEIADRPTARPMPTLEGRIELREVTFGYEKHLPVLKRLSLAIEPGEMIGLVGRSGAGKSTLINLVGRLYDPDEGAILIDGVDARDWRLEDLRGQVGYVLQDTFLFNGTIAENIAYARPEASREEIVTAAVAANAHEFILKLPDGYDTLAGERGSRLSGGERQRVAIARAILQNPRILVLDEATSSVDTETEAKIQIALGNLVQGRTTIAIAHRLSTLRHAKRLVVMEDGEVAEIGTHAELMEKEKGVYRKLVEIQSEWSRVIAVR